MNNAFEYIISIGKNTVFEDGMNTEFSRQLIEFINKYQNKALECISDYIFTENIADSEIKGEIFRWLGHIEDEKTYLKRLEILGKGLLNCKSILERDGAYLGLSYLYDPKAIVYLNEAIQKETNDSLKYDIQYLITELNARN